MVYGSHSDIRVSEKRDQAFDMVVVSMTQEEMIDGDFVALAI